MPASLRGSRSARTVLLRMAADQERAERIRKLKAENPGLTWRAIAETVGVTERAAADWAKAGGIAYENAKKLAEIFEVDPDYIWRGNTSSPDPFVRPASNDDLDMTRDEFHLRVDAVEASLDDARACLEELAEKLDRNHELLIAVMNTITATVKAAELPVPAPPPELARLLAAPTPGLRARTPRDKGSRSRARRQAS